MRIVSGFKDYYDFIAYQNADPKIVYFRECIEYKPEREPRPPYAVVYRRVGPHLPDTFDLGSGKGFAAIHVCGTQHHVGWDMGRFIYDLAGMRALADTLTFDYDDTWAFWDRNPNMPYPDQTYGYFKDDYTPRPGNLNQALNAPIVLDTGNGSLYTNIRLASLAFGQFIKPELMFMHLYNFLIPKEAEPDADPDNMTRYEAKGFDRKTSFRKDKKDR